MSATSLQEPYRSLEFYSWLHRNRKQGVPGTGDHKGNYSHTPLEIKKPFSQQCLFALGEMEIFLLTMLCLFDVTLRSPQRTNANALGSLQNLSRASEAAGHTQNSTRKGHTALQQGSIKHQSYSATTMHTPMSPLLFNNQHAHTHVSIAVQQPTCTHPCLHC